MDTERYTPIFSIERAYAALKAGDKRAARRWAQRAAAAAPQQEEPWLLLAATASPHASLAYLKIALQINPNSQRAAQGLAWAQKRPAATPFALIAAPPAPAAPNQPYSPQSQRPVPTVLAVAIVMVFAAILFFIRWAYVTDAVPGLAAFLTASEPIQAIASVETGVPFPTFTPTPTATQTSTATPTFTFTPPPSATPLPTVVPTHRPTDPPEPESFQTYVVKRGDTLYKISRMYGVPLQSLISANHIANPSSIQSGLKLIIPTVGTPVSAPEPAVSSVRARAVAAPTSKKQILVDLSDQRLVASEDGDEIFSFTISTGRNNTTLTGNFKILDKTSNAWSDPWGFWMPNWMGIYYVGYNLENGIHSLPVLTNGQKIWGDSIGTPISYGCIVLSPGDAQRLYDWAEIGTSVQIHP